MSVYSTRVFLTCGNLFPQLVCVPPEWRLRIVIIVILNAVVSVLTEVRNPHGKNASLLSVPFSRCTFVFYFEGHSSQHASMSGCCFLDKCVFLQMSL